MNVDVCAAQVAQRLFEPVLLGFEDKPGVPARVSPLPRDGETQLEGHVEAWGGWPCSVDLHAGEIVHRIPAALDQLKSTVQPAFAARDFERRPGDHAQGSQTCDVRKKQVHKGRVVWNVEEDVVPRYAGFLVTSSGFDLSLRHVS